jgi:undecaprenyl-diphosphatase
MHTIRHILTNKPHILVATLVLFWAPVVVFSKLAGEIVEREQITLDITILYWIHNLSTPWLDKFFLIITNLGGVVSIISATLLLLTYLIYKRQWYAALVLFMTVGGAAVANLTLKMLFHRDRPSLWHPAIVETSFSFPSGHAMLSAALIMSIIFIVWKTRLRLTSIIIGAPLLFLIGISRLYLGVHYPSDIVAGWCASLTWAVIVVIVINRLAHHRNATSLTVQ